MLAGVGPFAIERGLVTPDADETRVRIFDVNTGSRIEAIVQTPGGTVTYAGKLRIDGVPGTGAPVVLSFSPSLPRTKPMGADLASRSRFWCCKGLIGMVRGGLEAEVVP